MKHVTTKHSSQSRKRSDWKISRYRKSDYREVGRCAPFVGHATNGKLHQAIDTSGNTLTFTDRGITHSSGKGVTFDRDGQDRISAITGPDNKRVEYKYDTLGNLIAVIDQHGDTVQFTYLTDDNVPKHYLDEVIDPLGRTAAKTEFDEQGRIKKITDADGKTIEYEFDAEARIQKVTDQLGNTTIIENDERGNVIREVSPEGAITLRTYDTKGNIKSETQVVIHNGVEIELTTSYTYDADGNKKTETDVRGNVTQYFYNQYGQLLSTTSGGVTTKTNYDANTGLPTSTIDANGNITSYKFENGNLTSLFNSNGVQLIFSVYNNYGEVTSITSTNGRTTYMKYDNNGDCIATYYIEGVQKILDTTIYDEARRVTGRAHYILPSGTLPSGKTLEDYKVWETKTEYNAAGQVVLEVDQNGLKTRYTYDARGKKTETRSQLQDSDGNIVWYIQRTVYDAVGHIIATTEQYAEETQPSQITGQRSEYDRDGHVVKSEQLLGLVIGLDNNGRSFIESTGIVLSFTSTVYNNAGWILSSTNSYGLVTSYSYNVFSEIIETRRESINEDGHKSLVVTQTEYDSKGQAIKETINGVSTSYKYDDFGNIIKTVFADGTSISAEYKNSLKTSETNQLGQTRKFEYNSMGQLTAVTLPDGSRYVYDYDKSGNQTLIRDPNSNETKFTYDGSGNLSTRTLPDGSKELFEYDNFNRVIKHTSFEGVVTSYQYDTMGRVTTKTSTVKGVSEIWTYKYDSLGREIEVNQNDRIVKTTYNEFGQIASVQSPDGTISYEYDIIHGHQTRVYTDSGEDVRYGYDAIGRLQTVTSDGKTTTYSYDVLGNLVKETMPNGVITTYKYDNMNRLIKLTNFVDANQNGVLDTGELLSYIDYKLDLQGNKIKSVETFNVNGIEKQNVIDWTYDINSRLIKEVFDHYDDTFDQTLGFAYDFVGNRLRQTVDKGNDNVIDQAFAYFYDINDRLVEEWFDGQNDGVFEKKTNYEYDHTQQTLKSVSENGTIISETTFEYDLQGRMSVVTITTPTGVERISYEYDSNGIRVASIYEADGVITRTEYINDSQSLTGYSQVIRQTETVDGVVTKTISYVIGHQRISQIVTDKDSNQQKYYFTFDGHGSTRVLLGLTAAMTQLYSFDAYGNALGFDPAEALTEFLYSGEQFDAKIGQQYLRARYYDPATGRFNRLDPFFGNLNDPQSLHKYLYTHGNPINGIDPSGLMAMAMSIGGLGFGAGGETKYNAGVMATGTRVISTLRNVETFVNGALGSLSQVLVNAASQSQAILWCIVSNPSNAMTALKVVTAAASTVGVVVTSQMPIFWVPQLVMPNIYENTILALNHNPLWFKLSYNGGGAAAKINRTLAISGLGSAGAGWSWDEYPYASTKEGGSGAWVARVYSFENSIQGGYLSAFYTITLHHKIGESFLVVPVPSQLTYSTWKDILGF